MRIRAWRAPGGFTVVEALVVVFMIFAIIAMLIPTLGPMRRRSRLSAASSNVAMTLRLARSLAISNQATYNVRVVNLADSSYMAVYFIRDDHPTIPNSPLAPRWYDVYDNIWFDNDPFQAKHEATVFMVAGSQFVMKLPLRFCAHPDGDSAFHPTSDYIEALGSVDVADLINKDKRVPRFGITAEPGVNWNPIGQGSAGELYFLPDGSASEDCVICVRDIDDNLTVVGVKGMSGEITQKRVD